MSKSVLVLDPVPFFEVEVGVLLIPKLPEGSSSAKGSEDAGGAAGLLVEVEVKAGREFVTEGDENEEEAEC